MFSSRLQWGLKPNRLALALEARRLAGAEILDLTQSNPPHAGIPYPSEIANALSDDRAMMYEPSPAGLLSARKAVAAYYAARGHRVVPDRILLTASTSEAYSYLFKLLCDPGDDVLVPRPSYPLFGYLAELDSVRIVQYSLTYHGSWSIDFDSLRRGISSRTRAVVLVNPNNPTGTFLKRSELSELIAICNEGGLALISDEVFADYAFVPDEQRVTTLASVTETLSFSMSGLSKVAGLPQMKVGWIVLSGPEDQRRRAVERLELIADSYLSVSTPVQHALPRLLELGKGVQQQIGERVKANLAALRAAIPENSPCRLLDVEGGWYAILQVPRTRTEEEWCLHLLEQHGALVQPGYFYDFESEAYLVVSLLTQLDIFREGLMRLLALVA